MAAAPASQYQNNSALHHTMQILEILFGAAADRSFDIRYWDGTVEPGARATFTLVINHPGALRQMLWPPSELAIVEAFLSEAIDVEGTLENAVTLADTINESVKSPRNLIALAQHLRALPVNPAVEKIRRARASATVNLAGRKHAPQRDEKAIRYHYDVGNDFYRLWLDRRMVYSCAYFESADTTLDDAQAAKLDLVCRKLRLHPGERFLDVGCGWGGLIVHAAKQYGVTALGLTLSAEQAAFARTQINAAGLTGRCRVEIRDYRDIAQETMFDKIASVGMVEHVGTDHLPLYFSALANALTPGGLLLNHGIVSVDAARPKGQLDWIEGKIWRRDAFINEYVFPDGKLGSLASVIAAAEGAGFETRDVESLREHYTMTLRHWVSRLTANAERAIAMTDARTYRTWWLYMSASARAFVTGHINVVQTLLAKADAQGRTTLPLTRKDIYTV